MKQVFTFFLLLITTFVFSQDMSINLETAEIEIGEYIDYGTIVLHNNGNMEIEVACTLERSCYQEGDDTYVQICMGSTCFLNVDSTTTLGDVGGAVLILEPNSSSDAIKFTPTVSSSNMGSNWTLTFFDRNDSENMVTLSVSVGACMLTHTRAYAYEVGKAFPNPSSEFISIPYDLDETNAQLIVYNILGVQQSILNLTTNQKQVDLNVKDYSEGIYFYYLVDAKGKRSKAHTFVKK